MSVEKYDIKDLQEVWDFGVILGKSIIDDFKDNKITLMEIFALMPQVARVQGFLEHKQDIINQASDLSFDEIKILVKDAETLITNAEVVAFIQSTLNAVIAIEALVVSARTLFGKKPIVIPVIVPPNTAVNK